MSRALRIGHYSVGLWEAGGVASYVRRVSGVQRKLGHDVTFFNSGTEHPQEPAEWRAAQIADSAQLWRLATEQQLDVVHVHTKVETVPPPGLPVIRTVHGHQPYCPAGSKFLANSSLPCNRGFSTLGCLKSHIAERCGSVRPHKMAVAFQRTYQELATLPRIPALTVSNFLRDRMVDAGYPAEQIEVLHLMATGNDRSRESPPEGIPRFLFLGRLTPQKGVAWLLRSVARVRQPIALDIAGDGRSMADLRELSRTLGIDHLVSFHGWVDAAKVSQLLSAASAVVFPSVWHEPGGTVAFEAMSHRLPVIMSRVGGMPEVVIDQENGLLVDPGDVEGMAAAIGRIASDPALGARLGAAGGEALSRKYTLDAHVSRLLDKYLQVIAQARTGRDGE